jgi:hypothetical protein
MDSEPDKALLFKKKFETENLSSTDIDDYYHRKGALDPMYGQIVGYCWCSIKNVEGKDTRKLMYAYKKDGVSEVDILGQILSLIQVGDESTGGDLLLCGHNIVGYDIPFIVTRALKYSITIPSYLKKYLMAKPWESKVIDTCDLLKFGGRDYNSIATAAINLNLPYKTLPINATEYSSKYWGLGQSSDNWYEMELGNYVNLTLALFRKLREL